MFRKGSQGRLTADLNKMRENEHGYVERNMSDIWSSMPSGAQEVAARVPYQVGPWTMQWNLDFLSAMESHWRIFFGGKNNSGLVF